MFRAVCCGIALTAALLAAPPARALVAITFPAPVAATPLPSALDTVSIFGTYTNPTGIAPFAVAPFVLSFGLPSHLQVGTGNGSFSLSGITGSYANNGSITDFSGATVDVAASTQGSYGQITLTTTSFLASNGSFSLDVLTNPALFSYDSGSGVATLTPGIFALNGGSASYALDPSIAANAAGVTLSQPVPEPPAWALLLIGCLGIAALGLPRRMVRT